MAGNTGYDDRNLQQLFADLEPKRRLQAIKGGFRREANKVRKTAINNLRRSVHSNKDLEKGVRAIVFKRKAGFRVTVGTKKAGKNGKGEAGFYASRKDRKGRKKPVLIWLEDGTRERKTKGRGLSRLFRRGSSHHGTGRLKRYGFMAQAANEVRNTVTAGIHDMVTDNVLKTAKKYGCK